MTRDRKFISETTLFGARRFFLCGGRAIWFPGRHPVAPISESEPEQDRDYGEDQEYSQTS
jgi:hypothetical protein